MSSLILRKIGDQPPESSAVIEDADVRRVPPRAQHLLRISRVFRVSVAIVRDLFHMPDEDLCPSFERRCSSMLRSQRPKDLVCAPPDAAAQRIDGLTVRRSGLMGDAGPATRQS